MKKLIFKLLHLSGLVSLFRTLKQRRGVTIVLYHDPSPGAMERGLAYLKPRYNIISLEDYLKARINRTTDKLPNYSMIITFDDGHRGNYSLLPIFQKYEAPATIFLCSAIIDTLRHFWFIDAEGLLPVQKLKKLTNRKRIDRLAAIGFEEQKEYATRQALSRQEIEEMRPLIDFQSHTRFHPILTSCEPEQFSEEIIGSKKELEDHLGLRIFALAYPNGDYNNGIVEETRTAGYSCGLTVDHGVNEDITDLYMLRRLDVNDTENLHELAVKASGLWQYIKARCKL